MTGKPEFSVILPTRDRPARLARCLESLAALKYPRDQYEVIVIDDGGSCDLTPILERTDGMQLTLLRTPHAGPAAARNAGFAASRGAWLALIDDDCRAHPDWLESLSTRLRAHQDAVIGGRVMNALPANMYARASQELQDFLYRWYHEERRGELRFFSTNNIAVSRDNLDRIGAFDASFTFASEDRDWCDRALLAGVDLVYAPEAIVEHSHDLRLAGFLGQHFRYGKGARRFHSARAIRRHRRVRLEPLAFYRGMFASPFAGGSRSPVRQSILLFASQFASALGFVWALITQSSTNPAPQLGTQPASASPRPERPSAIITGN